MSSYSRVSGAVRVASVLLILGVLLLTFHWLGGPAYGAGLQGQLQQPPEGVQAHHPPARPIPIPQDEPHDLPHGGDSIAVPTGETKQLTKVPGEGGRPSEQQDIASEPTAEKPVFEAPDAAPTELSQIPSSFADDVQPDIESLSDTQSAPPAEGWHPIPEDCGSYSLRARVAQEPLSEGRFQLGYQRPPPACRTFNSSLAEKTITRMKDVISDPDLYRIFENTFPNTLDTAIKWKGVAANNSQEELCFVITGDIDAMWLRDSANQLQVYRDIMSSPDDDVASLFRGAINLQARYIVGHPYCNAFQAPPESGISPGVGSGGSTVYPPIDVYVVSTCNFELDSFGAFLQMSHDYYTATGDAEFFGKFQWVYAVQSMLKAAKDMMAPTYDDEGKRLQPPYTFNSMTRTMTSTLNLVGTGNPVARTGMVRSPFRPSDDTSVFEFLVPANMMFSRYLNDTAAIMDKITKAPQGLADEMRDLATEIHDAIQEHAVITGSDGQRMYAYEVDGFGGQNLMDDANVPSLLSAPFIGYLEKEDEVYRNTRQFVLSAKNPWFARGPVINAVGSPHIKPGAAWPMASIIQIMTTDNETEIQTSLAELVTSTDGLGLMHESINSLKASEWTREWFSWANGLFGQMILDLEKRKPNILKKSFQAYPG
ncbi:hypothetical protein jhhlp_007055 [Lomentospora prolificans]|uniref:Glycoside hydrolase family 125 protein n=1 Tax=Lomentospora prolificans TaxID=41688 RepID=A0A2N3N1K3_9PEZI|nr:hypothetical protein jhhlp_007055 [Lomentospora prolificans]